MQTERRIKGANVAITGSSLKAFSNNKQPALKSMERRIYKSFARVNSTSLFILLVFDKKRNNLKFNRKLTNAKGNLFKALYQVAFYNEDSSWRHHPQHAVVK